MGAGSNVGSVLPEERRNCFIYTNENKSEFVRFYFAKMPELTLSLSRLFSVKLQTDSLDIEKPVGPLRLLSVGLEVNASSVVV
jgi:hypothetical protein